jgi:hypothetical protein
MVCILEFKVNTLQISSFATGRVWTNERATSGFAGEGLDFTRVQPNRLATLRSTTVAVEALVPRGAMAEYGLIGLQFLPMQLEQLHCEVPYSINAADCSWHESLASSLGGVHLGLPQEYAPAVLVALSSAAQGKWLKFRFLR